MPTETKAKINTEEARTAEEQILPAFKQLVPAGLHKALSKDPTSKMLRSIIEINCKLRLPPEADTIIKIGNYVKANMPENFVGHYKQYGRLWDGGWRGVDGGLSSFSGIAPTPPNNPQITGQSVTVGIEARGNCTEAVNEYRYTSYEGGFTFEPDDFDTLGPEPTDDEIRSLAYDLMWDYYWDYMEPGDVFDSTSIDTLERELDEVEMSNDAYDQIREACRQYHNEEEDE